MLACFASAGAAGALPLHAIRAADWEAWSREKPEALRKIAALHDFKGQAGRVCIIPLPDGGVERALLGLGAGGDPGAFGAAARELPAGDWRLAAPIEGLSEAAIATAFGLGAYRFGLYKKAPARAVRLVLDEGPDADEISRIVAACWRVRDLVNTPANHMGPGALHQAAAETAARFGAVLEAVVGEDLLAQNYPLIHAVGRAAAEPPRLITLRWGGTGPRVAIVGKGVSFDAGGLNIKPGDGMRLMKKDMGGAAHALGLAEMIMGAGLPVQLSVYLPIAENAVDGASFRPGDVIAARDGQTVEIDNTDAEGRLILADALVKAQEDGAELILDLATLTGAARVALGPDLPPFMTPDDALAAAIEAGAKAAGDPVWRLPLWEPYQDDLDSPIADMKNSGGSFAGAITGGLFLKRFVTLAAWAHVDIYAWAPKTRGAKVQGGESHAIRGLYAMLKARVAH
jgi:leucyl aminopeptidase